jgi:hypothetical protein
VVRARQWTVPVVLGSGGAAALYPARGLAASVPIRI